MKRQSRPKNKNIMLLKRFLQKIEGKNKNAKNES